MANESGSDSRSSTENDGSDDTATEVVEREVLRTDEFDLTCSLSEAGAAQRREFAETHLAGRLVRIEELDAGAAVHFERTEQAFQAVTELMWRESRCCGGIDLSVELNDGADTIEWRIRSQQTDAAGDFIDQIRGVLQNPA